MNFDLNMDSYPWLTTIASTATRRQFASHSVAEEQCQTRQDGCAGFLPCHPWRGNRYGAEFRGKLKGSFPVFGKLRVDPVPSGSNFSFGVDGIALVLIALAATLVPVVILGGWDDAI